MKLSTAIVATTLTATTTEAWVRQTQETAFTPMLVDTYSTNSQVTDHCAIDMDQLALEEQLALKDESSFAAARKIYEMGGNSKSYAMVTLSSGLTAAVAANDAITGTGIDGSVVMGKAFADYPVGTTELNVLYETSDDMATYMNCKVGGLAVPTLDGCFVDAGTLTIGGTDYSYTYDSATQNKNDRTIAKFSTAAETKMGPESGQMNTAYEQFLDYYGTGDYGQMLIDAAFNGTATDFTNGNQDFSTIGFDGKEQIIKKVAAYMNTFMYVTYEFFDALVACNKGTGDSGLPFVDEINAWDEGVCFYTGSLPIGEGVLQHRLTEKRCEDYGTCTEGMEGDAKLNLEMMELFSKGQEQILAGDCAGAAETVDAYIKKMYIPLMQGTMSYAYEMQELGMGEKESAELAIFAASVLPAVHAVDPAAAEIIYENSKIGSTPDYKAVKTAFESVYDAFGVTCEEIGCFMDATTGACYPGMEACGSSGMATTTDATATDGTAAPAAMAGSASIAVFAAHVIVLIAAVVGLA